MNTYTEPIRRTRTRRGNAPASLDAYRNRVEPVLKEKQRLVLDALGSQSLTAKEVARSMGVELNTISGRFSELRKLGVIESAGIRREGSEVVRRVQFGQQQLF